ncbi:proline/glycine betaine ABC transporter substrate-binding protein ProX [Pseudomonas aeruginosa]|uniref:glycine betaine/L-proline ABC transporter substrate-binding protein ProX n=1 Tax=Pseudomonas TaxID=286 RepID=UPI000D21918C|nr:MULTISPECIES: glycine betaine/L-proline ABC transporter substrate-binding protein ProX [Pseudomonas]AVZ17504.1 proline/glycine betaine ABC transporter substrate-binding protein ProX [Pseudomonas aeruginosa]
MKVFSKIVILGAAVFSIAGAVHAQALPGDGKTIRYAQDSSLGGNYVVAQIVSDAFKALGYQVRLTTLDNTLFFPAVAQGDMDISTDITLPQREPGFKAVAQQAELVGDGMIVGGGINGYLIDKKTALAHNITSLEQMSDPKIAGIFGQNGKADLTSCDPSWSCSTVIDYQMDKFGLKQNVKQVRGKYEALMADVVGKVRSGKPAFFYAWSPSWMTNSLVPGVDVVWLPTPKDALPPNIPNQGSALVNDVQGCAGGANPCRMAMASWNYRTVVNKEFLASNPAVKALIQQVNFPTNTWSHWESTISKDGGSAEVIRKLSDEWIASNKSQFDQWVDVAKKAN